MNMKISSRTSTKTFVSLEERVCKVGISGASISAGYSISLPHHCCSKLPQDEYFDPKPNFFYFDDLGGTVCNLILPSNAPIHQINSSPQPSSEAAKKDACLKAIEQLHKLGALNDFLLPSKEEMDVELVVVSSDSSCYEVGESRGDIHEMLVPTALKEPWTSFDNSVYLCSYYIKFCPDPDDRIYKKSGLFVKKPLPQEAVEMELNLHLARGRCVKTKLVPSEHLAFNKIMKSQNFQEMFLKVIL